MSPVTLIHVADPQVLSIGSIGIEFNGRIDSAQSDHDWDRSV